MIQWHHKAWKMWSIGTINWEQAQKEHSENDQILVNMDKFNADALRTWPTPVLFRSSERIWKRTLFPWISLILNGPSELSGEQSTAVPFRNFLGKILDTTQKKNRRNGKKERCTFQRGKWHSIAIHCWWLQEDVEYILYVFYDLMEMECNILQLHYQTKWTPGDYL